MVMWYINYLEGQTNVRQNEINSLRREIAQRDVSVDGIIATNLCLVSEKTDLFHANALLESNIAALKAENEALKAQNEALKAQNEALKAEGDEAVINGRIYANV